MASSYYRELILAGNPLVFWPLDQGSSSPVAASHDVVDRTGRHAAPTLSNVFFGFPAPPGLRFSTRFNGTGGVSSAETLGSSFSLARPFTAELWFNEDSAGDEGLVGSNGNDLGWHVRRRSSTGGVRFIILTNNVNFRGIETTASLRNGVWHHLVAIYDGSGGSTSALSVWIDGSLQAASTISSGTVGTITNSLPLIAGNFLTSYTGTLAGIAVYNRILSRPEIIEHYNAGLDGPARTPLIGRILRAGVGTGAAPTDISSSDAGSLGAETGTVAVAKTDTDIGTAIDTTVTMAVAVAGSESASTTENVSAIALSTSDTATAANAGTVTDAIPPPAPGADTFTASSTGTLAVAVTGTDTAALAETATAVIPTALAISDTDTAAITDLGTNASGGLGGSFIGVSLAFDNDAGDATPEWSRLDDPNGTL